jgi:predicted unusual protein kinase regulating ubiquinone biosynthesis (AarF/ABC1/UbiB family)
LPLQGLYVKLGQVLSVTAIPIPDAYRNAFRTLQSDVSGWEPFDEIVRPVIEAELGRPVEEIFSHVDPIPCGAASIGQAHKATLRRPQPANGGDGGSETLLDDEQVVIKVQYPNAKWQVPADIHCIGDFLKLCVWFGVVEESSARLSYEEFARQFLAELDYERECQNLKAIYQSTLDPEAPYQKRGVVVPQVFDELCTKQVITMTYLPGPKLQAEAQRQLQRLGIDTTSSQEGALRRLVLPKGETSQQQQPSPQSISAEQHPLDKKDVTKTDAETNGTTEDVLLSRNTASSKTKTWKLFASKWLGSVVGVDSMLWAARYVQGCCARASGR